ncbi:uncharacterized protein LOC143024576 [Oratosquilla oratoria]|uniref:uncharacterized protein LOC143024576 n=1 Tax=Oratosquilla oratoria TaxID=337810 RepID=UPI003F763559
MVFTPAEQEAKADVGSIRFHHGEDSTSSASPPVDLSFTPAVPSVPPSAAAPARTLVESASPPAFPLPLSTSTSTISSPPPSPSLQSSYPPTAYKLPSSPSSYIPQLPSSYEIRVEVLDVHKNSTFFVTERERDAMAAYELTSASLNLSCIYSASNAEVHIIEGIKCSKHSGQSQKCFCVTPFCRHYVSVGAIVRYLKNKGAKLTQATVGGVDVWAWRATSADMTVEAVYTRATATSDFAPLAFSVRGSGRVFLLPGGAMWLQYQVRSWSKYTKPVSALIATPPGVLCPPYERKFLPKLANQFSLTMETVIENLNTVAYESHYYETEEKLVSFTYRPHLHADGMFFLSIPGLTKNNLETFRIIHDFKTGIQYMINEKTSNCSIQGIPLHALDAISSDNQHIRLRHASELISIDSNHFIYKGTRVIRGIVCDVWVAERRIRKGQYTTVEVYFSHENWTVEVEVFNKVRQVPIGISSYLADEDNPTHWTSTAHTFFYEYSDGHPSWRHFDISPCLNRINRLFLIFTLEVSYSDLVRYNVEAAKNSIRRAVAGIAGVSPLRITDLFLSSRADTGEVDVWFVLLEKPDITGVVLTPRPQLLMADAYKLLHDITHKHNVSVKLDVSPTKKVFVTIKRGSLETTTEALHPHMRHKSMRYLKAGYTAGSMAGLGFSMAILGTCVGIFIGFLLWKRNTSIPYKVTN